MTKIVQSILLIVGILLFLYGIISSIILELQHPLLSQFGLLITYFDKVAVSTISTLVGGGIVILMCKKY